MKFQHFHNVREHKSVHKNEFKARAGYPSCDQHARFSPPEDSRVTTSLMSL